MRSPLLVRSLALVVLLVVPLALAVASQALASRPDAPRVGDSPVRLSGTGGGGSGGGADPGAPTTPPATDPTPTTAPTAPPTSGPRVVSPAVPQTDGDDDDEEPDDDDDADDADD